MTEEKVNPLDDFNKDILIILNAIKESYGVTYPNEYKIIKQSLTTVSKELTNIRMNQFKIETDENNKSYNKPEM